MRSTFWPNRIAFQNERQIGKTVLKIVMPWPEILKIAKFGKFSSRRVKKVRFP